MVSWPKIRKTILCILFRAIFTKYRKTEISPDPKSWFSPRWSPDRLRAHRWDFRAYRVVSEKQNEKRWSPDQKLENRRFRIFHIIIFTKFTISKFHRIRNLDFRLDGPPTACARIDEILGSTELFQKNKTKNGGLLAKNPKNDIMHIISRHFHQISKNRNLTGSEILIFA